MHPITPRNPMKKNDEETKKEGVSWAYDTPSCLKRTFCLQIYICTAAALSVAGAA